MHLHVRAVFVRCRLGGVLGELLQADRLRDFLECDKRIALELLAGEYSEWAVSNDVLLAIHLMDLEHGLWLWLFWTLLLRFELFRVEKYTCKELIVFEASVILFGYLILEA